MIDVVTSGVCVAAGKVAGVAAPTRTSPVFALTAVSVMMEVDTFVISAYAPSTGLRGRLIVSETGPDGFNAKIAVCIVMVLPVTRVAPE